MKKCLLMFLFTLTAGALYSQWIDFPVQSGQSVWASSVLSETLGGKLHSYDPEFLFDGDSSTAWVEGAPDEGIGENLIILTNKAIRGLSLINGFTKSDSLYEKNNRIKKMDLSILIGFTAPGMVSENDYYLYKLKEYTLVSDILVEDRQDLQFFEISLSTEEQFDLCREVLKNFAAENPFLFNMMLKETGFSEENYLSDDMNLILMMEIYGFLALQLTIKDVYRGSRYNDSCLSEISMDLEEF